MRNGQAYQSSNVSATDGLQVNRHTLKYTHFALAGWCCEIATAYSYLSTSVTFYHQSPAFKYFMEAVFCV